METTSGSCPCHPDIEQAIAAHQNVVTTQAKKLGGRPGRDGWDDLISDGMVALWKALIAYDPSRGNLDQFLSLRVRFRMIDGLRQRETRASNRPQMVSLEGYAEFRRIFYSDELTEPHRTGDPYGNNLAVDHDYTSGLAVADLLADSSHVDPRLPRILDLASQGYTHSEIGEQVGLSRTRIWQLVRDVKLSA